LSTLFLLQARDERRHHSWERRRKFLSKYTGHDAEEQKAALPQACATKLDALKGLLHKGFIVRPEKVLPNSLSESANGIHRNPTQLCLLAFISENEEVLHTVHRLLEVLDKLIFRRMRGTTDRARHHSLDIKRCGLQQTGEALHNEGKILVNHVMEDFEQRIERRTC
jgi:hypothetical protein